MKTVLIASLALLALITVPAECQLTSDGEDLKVKTEVNVELREDETFDVAEVLQNIFDGHIENEGNRLKRSLTDGNLDSIDIVSLTDIDADADPDPGARQTPNAKTNKYNRFFDVFLGRLSKQMERNSDPLRVVLRKGGKMASAGFKKGNKGIGKGGNKRGGNKKGKKRNINKNRGNKNRNNKNNRNKNQKRGKGRRNGKELESEDGEEENEEIEDDEEEVAEEGEARVKREIPSQSQGLEEEEEEEEEEYFLEEEEEEGGEGRALDLEEEDYEDEEEIDLEKEDTAVEGNREGKALTLEETEEDEGSEGKEGEAVMEGRQRRRRRRKGPCKRKCKRNKRRRQLINKRRRIQRLKKNKKRGKRSAGPSSIVLSGLSKFKRKGDVRVATEGNTQIITGDFNLGPVLMRAEKKVGKRAADVRRAEAMASNITGTMKVKVTADGKAKVTNVVIKNPNAVRVSGSLDEVKRRGSDSKLKNLLKKSRFVISDKMKSVARKILNN